MSGLHMVVPSGAQDEVTHPAVVWDGETPVDPTQWTGVIVENQGKAQAKLKWVDGDGTHATLVVSISAHIQNKKGVFQDGMQASLNGTLNMGWREVYTAVAAVNEAVEKLTEAQNKLLTSLGNKLSGEAAPDIGVSVAEKIEMKDKFA